MKRLRKAAAVLVVLMFLSTGIVSIIADERTEEVTEKKSIPVAEGDVSSSLRNGAQGSSGRRINQAGVRSVLTERPMEKLLFAGETKELPTSEPMGDPGSGWTYDILVSDQPWNMYNDGFQSMETDPTNMNDIYVVYESWTSFATGTDQWCLVVRRSTNGGETWSPEIWVFAYPVQINGVYPDMKEADIAISNSGMIWIAYTVFAYDGPARNILDMQVFYNSLPTANWGTGPWDSLNVTGLFGGAYNYHRLPTITARRSTNVPYITAMSYDAIAATQSSMIAWQYALPWWNGWEILPGPVNANYVQYPCMDSGASFLYVTAMNYFSGAGVFDMRIWRSTDGGMVWTALTDIYDPGNVNSFYKPCVASTKTGTDYVMCSATYTPDPGDMSLGDIAYAYSLDGGNNWNPYNFAMGNYQRMPYVQEDWDKTYFLMSYRQEDGGPTYSTRYLIASTSDLTSWFGPELAGDTGCYQASNWFAHVAVQRRPDGQDYPCIAWSDLRAAAMPITETSDTHIVYSTYGARFTIDTDPTGLEVMVDSVTYTAPQLFNWPAGYVHQLEVADFQTGGGGETYMFYYWSNGGEDTQTSVMVNMTDETVIAFYLELEQFVIPLLEGWNLVSLPFIQIDEDIPTVLSSIAGKWDYVMAYDPTYPGEWRSNNIYRPDQLDDLNNIDHMMGFWINITEPGVDLTVEGLDWSPVNITLYAGWNLVGYPTLTQTSVASALIGTGYDEVAGFDPMEPYLITPLDGTYLMRPGEGYWIHVPADTVWTVDW